MLKLLGISRSTEVIMGSYGATLRMAVHFSKILPLPQPSGWPNICRNCKCWGSTDCLKYDKQKQLENNEDRSLLWGRFIVPALFPQIKLETLCGFCLLMLSPNFFARILTYVYWSGDLNFLTADEPF